MSLPQVGAMSPNFIATVDDGSTLEFKSLRGAPVVLFFYPKDDTSG